MIISSCSYLRAMFVLLSYVCAKTSKMAFMLKTPIQVGWEIIATCNPHLLARPHPAWMEVLVLGEILQATLVNVRTSIRGLDVKVLIHCFWFGDHEFSEFDYCSNTTCSNGGTCQNVFDNTDFYCNCTDLVGFIVLEEGAVFPE